MLLEILDFVVRRPLTMPELCSTTTTAAAQQARLLALANIWRCTVSVFVVSHDAPGHSDTFELLRPLGPLFP